MHRNFTTCMGLCRRRMRAGLLGVLLVAGGWAQAAEPALPARYKIDQPVQPLSESLHAIARSTGSSVLFDPAAVKGLMAGAVSGQFSASEAITRVLQGSGMVCDVMADGSIVVRSMAKNPARQGAAAPV